MGNSTVFANGQGISSSNSGAVSVSGPDVCLTQVGNSIVPIPYVNTARSSTLADGSKTVKIDGGMAAIDGCCYKTSTGDEPGSLKGVASGTVGGKAKFINYSFDVKIEGKGVCRNFDPMTHNNKNAIGMNQDSSDSMDISAQSELPEKNVFRIRLVEHISWDTYDEEKERFNTGHKTNKPIANKTVKIKMPDGSLIDKTTDDDGVIELTDQDPIAEYEVIFEPGKAKSNNKHHLFYNSITTVDKKLQ